MPKKPNRSFFVCKTLTVLETEGAEGQSQLSSALCDWSLCFRPGEGARADLNVFRMNLLNDLSGSVELPNLGFNNFLVFSS